MLESSWKPAWTRGCYKRMDCTKWPSLSYLDKMGYSKVNLNLCFHQFRSGVSHEIFHLIICKSLCIIFCSFAIIPWNPAKHTCTGKLLHLYRLYLKEQVVEIYLLPSDLLAKMWNPSRFQGSKCFERNVKVHEQNVKCFDCRVYAGLLPCCSSRMRYQLVIITV